MSKLFAPFLTVTLIFTLILSQSSCRKDVLDTDPASKLSFSVDTVYFDTVFVTLGSVTQRFKIYNNSKDKIKISRIKLEGGNSSPFRLNIDGFPSDDLTDLEIEGEDSVFVFAEVTIDPNNLLNPFVVEDSIRFETNGNVQYVKLLAYGRNADFFRPTNFPANGFPAFSVVECNTTWTNEKPKVIIGYLAVDSACTLTIEAGTEVYLYNNSGLWVYKQGTLIVNGTREDSVIFQGVRKEEAYREESGQWDRIWINQGSTGNVINYAVIKNGNIGIQAEDVVELGQGLPRQLTLSNTRIRNMTVFGLYAVNYRINAWNNVISNCGSHALALINGGEYNFRHNTIANYWGASVRSEVSVYLSNARQGANNAVFVADMNFRFRNGIVYGNLQGDNELEADGLPDAAFNWNFENSLIRLNNDDISQNDASRFTNCIFNENPEFKNTQGQNYGLLEASPARDFGSIEVVNEAPAIPEDIKGNSRISDTAPDLGALEFEP
ncbi:MAG: hypothetical protein WED33_11710 [Bacteroidia bacterium]